MATNKISNTPHRYLWFVLIGLFCLIGLVTVLYSTVWGAALSDDSFFYISSARNLLGGHGFDLVAKVPPLLTLLLSFIGLFKVDPLSSIRWVNAMLFALNIFLVGRILLELTKSLVLGLLGALFTLVSSTLIMVHSWAMSEALYISLSLCGILVYTLGHKKDSWKTPFFTGLFFGLAAATRYIGVSLLMAGGIVWLTESGKTNRLRLRKAIIFGVTGIIPLLLWVIRNQIITGQPAGRVFSMSLIPKNLWINFLNTVLVWFIPGRFVHGKELFWLGGIILLLAIFLGIYIIRNRRGPFQKIRQEEQPIILICLCIVSYLVILIISRIFFDNGIPFDERLLSPILAMGLILLVWMLEKIWNYKRWLAYGIVVILILMVLITNSTRSFQMVQSYHEDGRGYASARDHISETYAYLRNRPDIPIFSNAFVAIYFWTDRVTNSIPPASGLIGMKENMKRTGALLVIFDSIPVELYGTTREELTQGLVEQIRLSEATIYKSP